MNKKEEIFTIGDKTTLGIITCFRLLDNEIMVDFENRNSILLKSKQLQHIKTPLFTTFDNVDIFKGDISFGVNSNFKLSEVKHINKLYIYPSVKEFSTKEKAEEYILLNKPCLSYNEVLNATKIRNKNTFETLKDLVKSKIQQSV